MKTVPKAPEPRTLVFLNSVSFSILSRAWFGASPLGVKGSTSYDRETGGESGRDMGRETGRETGRESGRDMGGEMGRMTDKQTDRQIES